MPHIPLGNNAGSGKVRIGNDGFFGDFGERGEGCDHRLPRTVLSWVEHGARVLCVCVCVCVCVVEGREEKKCLFSDDLTLGKEKACHIIMHM